MTNESHRPHDDHRAFAERQGREAAAREAAPKGKARQFRVPTTATHFGDSLDIPHPPDADAMIVCTWNGGGLKPRRLMLLHQLYTTTVEDILAADPEAQDGVVVCIPIRSAEYVCVTGDGSWKNEKVPTYVAALVSGSER